MQHTLAAIFLLVTAHGLFAQPRESYEIIAIEYDIEGITQQDALKNNHSLKTGTLFPDEAALIDAVNTVRQELINLRKFETVVVSYTTKLRPAQPTAVTVQIETVDTSNIVILPYFKYDSNSGLTLAARFRDYNFIGTLETLYLDLDYEINNDGPDAIIVAPSLILPFRAAGFDWTWQFDAEASYKLGSSFSGNIGTALGISLPIETTQWKLTYAQDIDFGRNNTDYFLTSELSFGSSLSTGLQGILATNITYDPEISTNIKYRFDDMLPNSISGVNVEFSHGLSTGRIDWLGNFRNGLIVQLDNEWVFNTHTVLLSPEISASATGFLALPPFGLSARIGVFYNLPNIPSGTHNIKTDVGALVRGIRNDAMQGNVGFYASTDIGLSPFVIPREVMGLILPGVGLLIGPVEAHGSIFFDFAVATDTNSMFVSRRDVRYAIGIEGIGYPLDTRSLSVRLSIGIDPVIVAENDTLFSGENPEIFFGLGHHY